MTIYELTGEYLQLLEMAEDPDVDQEVLKDTLEALGGELEVKADGYAKVLRQLGADAEGIDAEIKRLRERKKCLDGNMTRIKDTLKEMMLRTGKVKFKTELFTFGIRKNPPAVAITGTVPEEFLVTQPPKADKEKIGRALKDGARFDWAALEQSESLSIR